MNDEDEVRPARKKKSGAQSSEGGKRLSGSDLREVATYQRGIILCILVYLLAVVGQFLIPQEFRLFLGFAVLGLGLVATVFTFLLSTKIYSAGIGVLLGVLTLIPCVGLIVLLVINAKATGILKERGINVGLLGADMSAFDK